MPYKDLEKRREYDRKKRREYRKLRREHYREYYRNYYYGLSPKAYQGLFESQLGRCAICKQPMKKPQVDHDHETGKVRGLLCCRCNMLMSFIDMGLIPAALQYQLLK